MLYWLIPNCAVRWRDGALGALIATMAIEILKVGFTVYIGAMSYYQTVYGALAAIPIFLLWMYISWMAVLLGAVARGRVAALADRRAHGQTLGRRGAARPQPGADRGAGAGAAARARLSTTQALAVELGVATTVIDEHMKPLAAAGFAAHTQAGSWVLAWNPETRDAARPVRGAAPAVRRQLARHASAPWQRQVAPAMERIVRAEAAAMQMTIASLIARSRRRTCAAQARRWQRPADAIAEKIGSEQVQGERDRLDEIAEAEPLAPLRAVVCRGRGERDRRQCDDLRDRDPRRRAVGARGAAQGLRRARLCLLHQPREPQIARTGRQPAGGAVFFVEVAAPAGAGRGAGRAGLGGGGRRLFRQPARATAGSAPGPRTSRGRSPAARCSNGGSRNLPGSSARARCRGRPSGRAFASCRGGSSSGRSGRRGCMTAGCLSARAANGDGSGCSPDLRRRGRTGCGGGRPMPRSRSRRC